MCKVCAQNILYFDINSLAHQQHFSLAFRCEQTQCYLSILHEQQLDHEIAFKQGALGQPQLIQWWHQRWQCSLKHDFFFTLTWSLEQDKAASLICYNAECKNICLQCYQKLRWRYWTTAGVRFALLEVSFIAVIRGGIDSDYGTVPTSLTPELLQQHLETLLLQFPWNKGSGSGELIE